MMKCDRSIVGLIQRLVWGVVFVALLICGPAADLIAGVLVAPTVVILSDKGRTGRIHIENPSNIPKEVEISFSYGLPSSDSLGRVSISLQDSNVTDTRSALTWIKAFPRKFLLEPNGSQVVRLVARPPKDLDDGEYWAQIVVQSQEGQTSFPVASDNEAITTQLNMIMKTVIAFKYRSGDLTAALEMTGMKVEKNNSQVFVLCDLVNKGNVSYLGILTCRLMDSENREVSYHKSNLAVYRDLRRSIYLPLTDGDFSPPYQVDLHISGEGRTDVPRENMIFGNEIVYTTAVE
ncbi:MAG: molecular chaperone [FCB group bacterium]|nr:molecular chaperone [FCB group bacterium]